MPRTRAPPSPAERSPAASATDRINPCSPYAEYRAIYKKLVDQVLNPDRLLVDGRYLQSIIRQHVVGAPNKLSSLEAFDKALTEAVRGVIPTAGGAGGPGGGGIPGGPGGPGGQLTPGVGPLVRARDEFVRQQLTQ